MHGMLVRNSHLTTKDTKGTKESQKKLLQCAFLIHFMIYFLAIFNFLYLFFFIHFVFFVYSVV